MAGAKSLPPDDSLRDLLEVKNGWLWWNKEVVSKLPHAYRFNLSEPIGASQKAPLLKFKGRQLNVSRVNYWFHTGEWPECVIHKDTDNTNNHIDNLIAGTVAQANAIRRFEKRTYSICERVTKSGKRRYYSTIKLIGPDGNEIKRNLGSFNTEAEALAIAINIRKILFGEFASADYA